MPAAIKGMLKFHDPGFKALRKEANVLDDVRALWDRKTWQNALGRTYDNVIFAPFQAAENVIRGHAFNVGLDVYMKKHGFKTVDAIRKAGKLDDAVHFARIESLNSAFAYGVLGRSPMLANPLLRPTTTLLSFPFKQAEFLQRTFRQDGGAFMRFIGLHGYLIGSMNRNFGVAAEDFLGWGFAPPQRTFGGVPIMASPQMRVLLDTVEGLAAWSDGDLHKRDRKIQSAVRSMPLALGVNPLPAVEFQDVTKLIERVTTKRHEMGDRGFVDIATPEAVTAYVIGRTTTMRARKDLDVRKRRAVKRLDYVLDKRARAVAKAMHGDSGDDLTTAVGSFAQPVYIEGQPFWPEWESYERRLENILLKQNVSQDILAMHESKFLTRMFLAAQLELMEGVQ